MRDTIDMAREAGCDEIHVAQILAGIHFKPHALKAFEALVRADERSVEPVANAKAIAECLAVLRPAVKGRFPHEQALEELAGYTTPPAAQRQSARSAWVGLTDEELRQVWYDDAPVQGGTYIDKLRQVETKLKEKNT
jgi:hypothetical protein